MRLTLGNEGGAGPDDDRPVETYVIVKFSAGATASRLLPWRYPSRVCRVS